MRPLLAGLWFRVFSRTRADERGAFAILAAILMTVMILGAALSVDLAGRVVEVRRDEATADMAALDAVRDLSADAATQDLAWRSALRNGADHSKPGIAVTSTRGTWNAGVFTPGGATPSAVKVTVSTPYNDFFGGTSASLSGSAIAQNIPLAQFSIGSTLADLNVGLGHMGVANLGLVGYNGLASGNFTLSALRTALGGSFSALTADQLLTSQVSAGQLASAAATLLGATDPTAAASVSALASTLSASVIGSTQFQLGDAFGLQQGNGVALGTTVNLLQAVNGGLQVANKTAGISLNLGLSAGGVTVGSLSVTGLVPAGISDYGPVGIYKSNTQVTATVSVDVPVTLGLLSVATVHLPLTLSLGGATGTLTAIDCTGKVNNDIKLATTFKNVNSTVGPGSSVTLAGLQLATVSGVVTVPSNPVSDSTVNNPANFVPNNAPVTVSSNLGSATANLSLSTPVTGLSLSVLDGLVAPIVANITSVASNLLNTSYGLNVGNADYLGIRASCATPHLVG